MDERELEYLREQIRSLQRSNTRWKLLAIGSLVCFGIFFLVSAGMFLFTVPGQVRVERMRMAEMEALMQAEAARADKLEAREAAKAVAETEKELRELKERLETMDKNKAEYGSGVLIPVDAKETEKKK